MGKLRKLLIEPSLRDMSLDDERRIEAHSAVLRAKPILRSIYDDFHKTFLACDREFFGQTEGLRIELGAGVAPLRDSDPGVLATDIVKTPGNNRQLDATKMDLADNSVRAFFGLNSFHHFAEPALFFREAQRTLKLGGGIILIEPYFGPFASFLFQRLHLTENFAPEMPGWNAPMTGPMSGANQALSYIVFWRDREKFLKEFPGLTIAHTEPLPSYLRYLFSGGFGFRQLVPNAALKPLVGIEHLAAPLRRWFAINHVIVLRRT